MRAWNGSGRQVGATNGLVVNSRAAQVAVALLLIASPLQALSAATASTGEWSTAMMIEMDNAGSALNPQVALDPSGNGIAVWYQSDGTRYNIFAARYTIGSGMGAPALIETDNTGDARKPQVASDGAGNAFAVWEQWDGTRYNIWGNRYGGGWSWGTAALIETNNGGSAFNAQVASGAAGNAVAVWQHHDGTRYNIWANQYTPATGWGTAGAIETDNNGDATDPQVAVDPNGNAVAVWQQSDGTRYNIWANRYVMGAGWGNASLIETDNGSPAERAQVAVDISGSATAVWQQFDGTRRNVWANRYVVGTGWGTAALIESDNAGPAVEPELAVDAAGNAVAVWQQSDGTRYNLIANRYVVGVGWGTAAAIETDNSGDAKFAEISVDARGNAVVCWSQNDGSRDNAWANRYLVGAGWGTAAMVETDNGGVTSNVQVAVDASGNAVAVWSSNDATRDNIWANRFVAIDTTPPSVTLTTPSEGSTTNRSSVLVSGRAEMGARVSVNGIDAGVSPNGSFAMDTPLVNGSNRITVVATDASGNTATALVNVTYDNPDRLRIQALENQTATLQAQLNQTNASLVAALAGQNTSLLQTIASLNSSLVASLAAQNASLVQTIANVNAGLLAALAAQNASLLQTIAGLNTSLLAALASQNATLLAQIASTNATLFGALVAQNVSLLAKVASTNATLFAALAAQNESLIAALADQNSSLLATAAAGDSGLAALIAETNSSLLAQLATQNSALLAALAAQNASLLASMAAQDDALLAAIAAGDVTLLGKLAATNASLRAKLEADGGALWAALNASAAESRAADSPIQAGLNQTNATMLHAEREIEQAQAAASFSTMLAAMALTGVAVTAVGSAIMGRRRVRSVDEPAGVPCQKCGKANAVSAKHCSACGAELAAGDGETKFY